MDIVIKMEGMKKRPKQTQAETVECRKPDFPLTGMQPGEKAVVTSVHGSKETKKRLEELGFVPGSRIEVLSGQPDGSRIVRLKQARLALTAGMAAKVHGKLL